MEKILFQTGSLKLQITKKRKGKELLIEVTSLNDRLEQFILEDFEVKQLKDFLK